MKYIILFLLMSVSTLANAQWTGHTSSSDLTSPISRSGLVNLDGYNLAQIRLNSQGTYYGKIGNPSSQIWSLGWGSWGTDINPVLTWSASGNVGIGTTSFGGKLDINAGSQYAIRTLTSSRYVIELHNTSDTDGGWWLVNDPNGSFAVHENAVGDQLTIKPGGSVGIGTTAPEAKLDVRGGILAKNNSGNQLSMQTNSQRWDFDADESMGNALRLRNMTAGSVPLVIGTTGNVGIGTVTPQWNLDVNGIIASKGQGFVNVLANEINLGDIASGDGLRDKLHLCTRDTKRMTLDENGNVGIGTTTPGSFRLAVEGKIGAREVNVTTNAWSDYVFNADYKLRPLAEVQQYIEENHHLPEVPSEKEVLSNGQNLGEMNAILLKKIEELTLYVLDLKQENEQMKNRIGKIEKAQN